MLARDWSDFMLRLARDAFKYPMFDQILKFFVVFFAAVELLSSF